MSVEESIAKKLCCVIGYPIEHSLSPLIHNAGYQAIGLSDYEYQAFPVVPEDLSLALDQMLQMGVVGCSVTLPHKINVLAFAEEVTPAAAAIGAANTLVNLNGKWAADNTDFIGILNPLTGVVDLKGKKVAILGASGAARAAAYAVASVGASLVIYNRTLDKAIELAAEYQGEALSFEQIDEIRDVDVIINCTPIGMEVNDESLVSKDLINSNQVIFDCVYNQQSTQLLDYAKEQGAEIIHGVEMFIAQAVEQFMLYTGEEVDPDIFRSVLVKHFGWEE